MCKVAADQRRKQNNFFFFFSSMLYIGCIRDLRTRVLVSYLYIDFENAENRTECTSIEIRVGNFGSFRFILELEPLYAKMN